MITNPTFELNKDMVCSYSKILNSCQSAIGNSTHNVNDLKKLGTDSTQKYFSEIIPN